MVEHIALTLRIPGETGEGPLEENEATKGADVSFT